MTWRASFGEPVGLVVATSEQTGAGWCTVSQILPFEAANFTKQAQHLSRDLRMASLSFQDRELIARAHIAQVAACKQTGFA